MLETKPGAMKRNILYLFAAILLLTSCYSAPEQETAPPPENLIDRDELVLILADVEIAESALRQKQNVGHEIKNIKETYYHSIFSKYNVSREQFDSSMIYYKQDPEVMDKIYEDVITKLSVMESEIQLEEE